MNARCAAPWLRATAVILATAVAVEPSVMPPKPAQITAAGQGLPTGAVQSQTDFGQPGFGGACPPEGDKPHRYQFTLHALKVAKLDLPASSMPALVGFMIHANEVASARFTAYYGR